jgi:AAT family amino acid transporter
MFSLARGGYAPEQFGRVTSRGTPLSALLISALGLLAATMVAIEYPKGAYVYLFGISLFGALFVWAMIFLTHLYFRRAWAAQGNRRLPVRMIGFPYLTLLGFLLIVAIMLTTWWVEGMRPTLQAGLPWLAFISLVYFLWMKRPRS